MAKKNQTAAVAPAVAAEVNKADAIRTYAAANPTATPAEIAKALAATGVEVSSGRVAAVLTRSKPKIDVDAIKAAAVFVKSYKGKIDDAETAIKAVGSFIDTVGGAAAALAALSSFRDVSSALA